MAHVNSFQEKIELDNLKPKIKAARIRQNKIEKSGSFHVVPGLIPETRIFIPKGQNIEKTLENYPKKITNNNGLFKIRV